MFRSTQFQLDSGHRFVVLYTILNLHDEQLLCYYRRFEAFRPHVSGDSVRDTLLTHEHAHDEYGHLHFCLRSFYLGFDFVLKETIQKHIERVNNHETSGLIEIEKLYFDGFSV